MKNLAIIPARGGSKGIPRKNIKNLLDKPLIAWTIEQALLSKNIDRVIVSTDDKEIAEVALKYGADVPFMRPSELSVDTAATEPCMTHAINWLEVNEKYFCDNVVLLQATSPVRRKTSIDNAFGLFYNSNADSLVSVCEFWHFLWENRNVPKALYNFQNRPRRQDIKPEDIKLKENGSIYITNKEKFMSAENRLVGNICAYVMDELESFEIDTMLDWQIIETILKNTDLGISSC